MRGEGLKVDVSGQKFIFPPHCACCGAAPQGMLAAMASKTTGKRVTHTTSMSWDFPYCGQCLGHVGALRSAETTQGVLMAGSALLALILLLTTGSFALVLIIALLCVGGSLAIGNVLRQKARAMCGPGCLCVAPAVSYNGWYGQAHSFEIASERYAYAFMHANKAKLINVDPHVWNNLHQGSPPVVRQTAKKFVR